MKIHKKFIGAKVKSNITNTYFLIEEGKEDFYITLGLLHIFDSSEPKIKKYVTIRKESDIIDDSNSDGAEDTGSPILAV